MTSSKPTKVGSFQRQEKKKMAYTNRTTLTVAPRKPLHLNCSLTEKSLMCGSLNVQPTEEATTFQSGGGRYDYKRISALQSNKIQSGCEELGVDNLALEIMPDHIHLFVGATPTHTPFKIVRKLKGNTSIQLRRCFPNLRYLGYNKHYGKGFSNLWAIGYYCGSAGHVSQEAVKRYILEQQGKDVFEYSVFGSPNQKIGNFTKQAKLTGWSG